MIFFTVFNLVLIFQLLPSVLTFQRNIWVHKNQRCKGTFISNLSNQQGSNVDDGINVSLLNDITGDSNFLHESIKSWLDEEYIIMNIHNQIGQRVSETYTYERMRGVNDIGDILVSIGTALESLDMKGMQHI
jgi:hypothetical protein